MSEFLNLRPSQLDIINRAFAEADQGNIDAAYGVIGNSNNAISKTNTGVKKSMDTNRASN